MVRNGFGLKAITAAFIAVWLIVTATLWTPTMPLWLLVTQESPVLRNTPIAGPLHVVASFLAAGIVIATAMLVSVGRSLPLTQRQ